MANKNSRTTSTNESLSLLLLALIGKNVVVAVKGGLRYQGILAAATTQGEFSLALRQAQLFGDAQAPVQPSLVILARDLLELEAHDVSLEPRSSERDSFKTDTAITGIGAEKREKKLQAWGGEGDETTSLGNLSLDEDRSGSHRSWDQFATNERLYGATTDYHEEIYTTKIDRSGPDYKAREQRAAQLEREILKGTGGSFLANNAHMAEERGIVDDSGMDEEDRYGAVIRNPDVYIPPGARKAAGVRFASVNHTNGSNTGPLPSIREPSPSATPSPQSTPNNAGSRASTPNASSPRPGEAAIPLAAAKTTPSLNHDFRQFVTSEKERLTLKRQAALKAAERKEQDSRLASLLEFSQTFKLKAPMPPDIASMLGRDPSKSASSSNTPVQSPNPVPRTIPSATSPPPPKPAARISTLLAEIPPFNPAKAKAASPSLASAAKPPTLPTASTSKINPNAPAFVFKPNPNANAFTPNFTPRSPAVGSTPRKQADLPVNPFFGTKSLNKGSPSMHVKEDFSPFKNGAITSPASIVPSWVFTGKRYSSIFPSGSDEDPTGSLPIHHPPPGPPPVYGGNPMYPPPNFQQQPNRFQSIQQPMQQQPMQQMPPPPGNIFPYPPVMGFPPPPVFNAQMHQAQHPSQFRPQQQPYFSPQQQSPNGAPY